MTLQNEHILMEEAHRRVAQRLRDAEIERFGRSKRAVVVATGVGVASLTAAVLAVVVWVVMAF